ncbi:MAG: hypothetical protein NTX65_13685 [Ignavibacteriales bacterium]|nr:hypothetical protein [Ignavibacteriales bacterium]
MNKIKKKILLVTFAMISPVIYAQTPGNVDNLVKNPDANKIIPDKFLEIGIPLLFLFLVFNIIVTVIKNREENKLKLRVLEKGVSEDTLIQLFKESNIIYKLQSLKMFLLSGALGAALLLIYLLRDVVAEPTGYLPLSIILIFISLAFYTYSAILNKNFNK